MVTTNLRACLINFCAVVVHVFAWRQNLKIAQVIIQRVFIFVMNMLISPQPSPQMPLHNNAMFWLVMAIAYKNIPVTIFNVPTSKLSRYLWRTVTPHQGIVIRAKSFGPMRFLAPRNCTFGIFPTPDSGNLQGIAAFQPALVVHKAQTFCSGYSLASVNFTLFFGQCSYLGTPCPLPAAVMFSAPTSRNNRSVTAINRACLYFHAQSIAQVQVL